MPSEAVMRDKFQVLVVNENSSIAVAWQTALERAGYHVMRAGQATAALDRLAVGNIDVMIVDSQLPDMTAELLTRVARERWPKLRVVMHAAADSRQLGLRSDPNVVLLSKQPTARTLKTQLERLLPVVATAPAWTQLTGRSCGAGAR